MEEMKNGGDAQKGKMACTCSAGCHCGCAGCTGCGRRVIGWVIGIIILAIVFFIGMKAGEFRNTLRNSYGDYYHGYPMMQYHGGYGGGGGAAPAATGTTSSS